MAWIMGWLQSAFIICGLLGGSLLLIHALPYDNHELRQVVEQDGCAIPCFIGIIPGQTTAGEALKRLTLSDWTEKIEAGEFAITWLWNGKQPAFLFNSDSPRTGLMGGIMLLTGQTVRSVTLSSQLVLGDLYLLLGKPHRISNMSIYIGDHIQLVIPYQDGEFTATVRLDCPVNGMNYWQAAGSIVWSNRPTNVLEGDSTGLRDLLPIFRTYEC
ncbi:MAG: hypothetical protein R3E39_31250 [Anaerolineae bacterium]